jgi:CDP-glycerol glycerophosphotransferase
VRVFPQGYETYDVLNTADILITDYSSVFFDFANSKRKIILFNYDEDEYISYRGTYFSLEELPFPKVQTIDDLVSELNSPKDYDDDKFLDMFCTYDRPDAVEYICRHIFKGENVCRETSVENDKENILIFAGALYNNGIRSSLLNLLNNVDRERYNYFISFKPWDKYIKENHEEIFNLFPENIEFLPFRFILTPTIKEKMDYNKFYLSTDEMDCPQSLRGLFERSFKKQYFNVDFKCVIDFDGYNKDETLILANSGLNSAIWVHSDMIQEAETKGSQNLNVLKEAYSKFDNVCVVSPTIFEPTARIIGNKDKIRIVHNVIDYKRIVDKSNEKIEFDEDTLIHSTPDSIEEVLFSKGIKFISIGRFSPEKGHERLIKAFNEFCGDFPDSQLIIIGGYGDLYESTVKLADSLEYGSNVTLIKGISNPMPILKECDLFILPSYYEGWGIVILEADILKVPVIATDIDSLQWVKEYGGNLVENSQEGILNGMYSFMEGRYEVMNIDYEDYDSNALDEFYSIIKSK